MSETNKPPEKLVVPPSIEAVIASFDARDDIYTMHDIHSALCEARKALENAPPEENYGAWAEVLAFGLTGPDHNEKPWGTYFGPIGSATNADGETVYFPDISDANQAVVNLWAQRAQSVKSSALVARYSDLVWDLSETIAKQRPPVEFARAAIDSYLRIIGEPARDLHDRFPWAKRALSLSLQVRDATRRDATRKALLVLHREAVAAGGRWWEAFRILEQQPKAGVTDEELSGLIGDIEAVLARVSNTADPKNFDPHATESAANMLTSHYRRTNRPDEVKRLQATVGRAFEHFGTMGDALLASMVLQTSMDAYHHAGLNADADRILRLIEKANVESMALMKKVEVAHEISAEDIEEFKAEIVGDTESDTFSRIAFEFMIRKEAVEKSLSETTKAAPLSAIFAKSVVREDRVVAHIGSLDDDPMGHLINHASQNISFLAPWLGWAIDHAKETHGLSSECVVRWCNRTALFDDGKLLQEGVAAWSEKDFIKAFHVLIPQIESAFRQLLRRLGRTVTKAHPQMPQARMVIPMGELLFNQETVEALGPHGEDLVLHLRVLCTDPRGRNFRNDVAHGLLPPQAMNEAAANWLVHAVILLGAWLSPSGPEEAQSENNS